MYKDTILEEVIETTDFKDERFTPVVRDIIARKIVFEYVKPATAANAAKIPRKLYNRWMKECEDFRLFIEELEDLRNSRIMEGVLKGVHNMIEAEDPRAVDSGIKLLERLDDSFIRKSKITKKDETAMPRTEDVEKKAEEKAQELWRKAQKRLEKEGRNASS